MGDAGEGLIDTQARIEERLEDVERERAQKQLKAVRDPEKLQALESLRLARKELERQLISTTHDRRRVQLGQAIEEIDRRMAEARASIGP